MRLFLDNDTDVSFDFDIEKTAADVIGAVLYAEGCPYDVEVNLLLTDDEGIRVYNRENRGIDNATDVLSFPGLDFVAPGAFDISGMEATCTDPETGLITLGDIIISVDRVRLQAELYGHSVLREFAFLVAHSMYHLSGYDHMTEEDAELMEAKQESILETLGIKREEQ